MRNADATALRVMLGPPDRWVAALLCAFIGTMFKFYGLPWNAGTVGALPQEISQQYHHIVRQNTKVLARLDGLESEIEDNSSRLADYGLRLNHDEAEQDRHDRDIQDLKEGDPTAPKHTGGAVQYDQLAKRVAHDPAHRR